MRIRNDGQTSVGLFTSVTRHDESRVLIRAKIIANPFDRWGEVSSPNHIVPSHTGVATAPLHKLHVLCDNSGMPNQFDPHKYQR
jgi:hypothetical protein